MDTSIVLTLHLATAIGLYAMAACLGILFAPERMNALMTDMERSPGMIYAFGVIAFAIGATIVMVHDIWTDPLAIIVTLIGWWVSIEGLLLLALPDVMLAIARIFQSSMRLWCGIGLVLGLLLFLAGQFGRATIIPA